jgi:serine/threonine-protein kinase PknG
MDGAKCDQPGCGGTIEAGYCNRCGMEAATTVQSAVATGGKPGSTSSVASSVSSRTGSTSTRRGSGSLRARERRNLGLGLVTVPTLALPEPELAILADPQVPDHKRFCSNPDCHDAAGNPTPLNRRQEGHCPQCGQRYSYVPTLRRGDLIADQYEVRGCLAYGGLGWIYLARDNTLGRWVVLKGLLNAADESAAAAAVAERQFLAAVKHANIVGIYNFVKRDAEGYIVMEYVNGATIKDLRKKRGPLPPAEAIAYVHRVLGAFGYLHRQGLVYCDMKPDNFMLEGDPPDVKLIDMGGVRRIDDLTGDIYGTRGYSAPEAGEGPTQVSDLFTLGRTLAVLLMDFRYQSQFEFTIPSPSEYPVLAQYDSLYRFLLKATASDPDHRFQSAEEMADQLGGVLREVVAGTVESRPFESTNFGGDVLALRSDASDSALAVDASLLPDIKVNPEDPAAGFLLSLAAVTDSQRLAALLREAAAKYEESIEVPFLLARSLIDLAAYDEAETHLARMEARDPFDWRVTWYRGRSLLARHKAKEARDLFDQVYGEVPGELAAKLAVALAAEESGDHAAAARLYDVVSRTDPAFTAAAFGLARCHVHAGRRTEAVEAYRRVPHASSLYTQAQMALARTLLLMNPGVPGADELQRASAVIEALALVGVEHAKVRSEILQSALTLLTSGAIPADPSGRVLGQPLLETPLRKALEQALRQSARLEVDRTRQIALVDRANRVRPVTLF